LIMSASKELNEKAIALHKDLLKGHLTASAQLAEFLLPQIYKGLSRKFPSLNDEHLIQIAANDAILYYLQSPNNFDASRGSLISFVWQRAESNLLNLLQKNRKQNKFVELDEVGTVYSNEKSQSETIEQFLMLGEQNRQTYEQLEKLLPDRIDQAILRLMLNGERETEVFAGVLEISDKSPKEQRDCVKKHKDRIKKVIRRRYRRQI
jgi:RNA polymerase sigma-70 factor (ECF subfamily)